MWVKDLEGDKGTKGNCFYADLARLRPMRQETIPFFICQFAWRSMLRLPAVAFGFNGILKNQFCGWKGEAMPKPMDEMGGSYVKQRHNL